MKYLKLFLFVIPVLLTSCKKEEKSGYGNYIISCSNYTTTQYYVTAKLDGVSQGSFFIQANMSVSWSTTSPCDDLVQTSTMDNVRIFTLIPNGDHTLELVDNSDNNVLFSLDFSLKADQCSHQPLILD